MGSQRERGRCTCGRSKRARRQGGVQIGVQIGVQVGVQIGIVGFEGKQVAVRVEGLQAALQATVELARHGTLLVAFDERGVSRDVLIL